MKWSEEQLKEVEAFAAKLMPVEEVAIIVGISPEELYEELKAEKSELALAYLRGVLKTKAAANESIIKLARQGSSPAQTLERNLLREETLNRVKNF